MIPESTLIERLFAAHGLRDILTLVMAGALGYYPVYQLADNLCRGDTAIARLWKQRGKGGKRVIVLCIAMVFAVLAWHGLWALGGIDDPASIADYVERVFEVAWKVGGAAFFASQYRHGDAHKEETPSPTTPSS